VRDNGAVLSTHAFRPDGVDDVGHPGGLSGRPADGDGLWWLDLVDATDEELEQVGRQFELESLALDDLRLADQRPKLKLYPTHALVVAYARDADPTDLPEVDVLVGPGWVVTVRKRNEAGRCLDVEPILTRFERTRDGDCHAGVLLYTILDEVVDGYFDLADSIDGAIEALEDDIFAELTSESADDDRPVQRRILDLRKDLLHFRRRVIPLRDVLMAVLRREIPWIDERAMLYFQNVLDHQLRLSDQIDAARELLGNAVDAHLATMSNRVNDIMKKMTSWGAILLGATLIAGIYGMNFRHMPELNSRFGYPLALASMLLMTIGLVAYFRRKKWL
jgi:magnesium transporter